MKIILVTLLCSSMAFLNPSTATAGLMTIQDINQRSGHLSQEIIKKIDDPKVQEKLAEFGISPQEAKERVAALSDNEIRDMMNSNSAQAGGDVVVISLTTILLIVIIVLLIR